MQEKITVTFVYDKEWGKEWGKPRFNGKKYTGDIEEVKALCAEIKKNTITSISLFGFPMSIEGIQYLSEALKQNTSLTSINMDCNDYGEKDIKYIGEALTVNKSIRDINLGFNSIGVKGSQHLSEALKVNQSITSINLGDNSIGDEGMKYLCEGLKNNNSITSINLSNNSIGAEGMKYLSEALKVNQSITSINLGDNSIGDEGMKYLCEGLKSNNSITSINLGDNSIGDEGMKYLCEAVKHNHRITSIELPYKTKDNDKETYETLQALLARNLELQQNLDRNRERIGLTLYQVRAKKTEEGELITNEEGKLIKDQKAGQQSPFAFLPPFLKRKIVSDVTGIPSWDKRIGGTGNHPQAQQEPAASHAVALLEGCYILQIGKFYEKSMPSVQEAKESNGKGPSEPEVKLSKQQQLQGLKNLSVSQETNKKVKLQAFDLAPHKQQSNTEKVLCAVFEGGKFIKYAEASYDLNTKYCSINHDKVISTALNGEYLNKNASYGLRKLLQDQEGKNLGEYTKGDLCKQGGKTVLFSPLDKSTVVGSDKGMGK